MSGQSLLKERKALSLDRGFYLLDADGKHTCYWQGLSHIRGQHVCNNCHAPINVEDFYLRCCIEQWWENAKRYCEKCADEHLVLCSLGGP